jgi:hypothetical protein
MIAYLCSSAVRLQVWGVCATEGAMLKVILGNKSVPRVEIDQRVRDARLRASGGSFVFSASLDLARNGERAGSEGG